MVQCFASLVARKSWSGRIDIEPTRMKSIWLNIEHVQKAIRSGNVMIGYQAGNQATTSTIFLEVLQQRLEAYINFKTRWDTDSLDEDIERLTTTIQNLT